METAILWPLVLVTVSSFSAGATNVSTTGPPSGDLPSVHQQPCDNGLGAVVAQVVREQTAMAAKQQAMETTLADTQRELEATKTKLEVAETSLNATKTQLGDTTSKLQAFRADVRLGSSFVRWGRKTCPNNTVLVYEGVAGGKQYDQQGSGTNRLCLTRTPQFDDTPKPSAFGFLYGAEYEHIPFHQDHDVPCSVCLAPQSTTIMVPATLSCPPGWTPQYSGHLASQYKDHHATEYVCLDASPEDISNAARNDNGLLFYLVVTVCGSLPCPPYINERVVTCVVCSK